MLCFILFQAFSADNADIHFSRLIRHLRSTKIARASSQYYPIFTSLYKAYTITRGLTSKSHENSRMGVRAVYCEQVSTPVYLDHVNFFFFFFVFHFKQAPTSLSTHASSISHQNSTIAAARIEHVTTNSNQSEISLPLALDDSVSLLRSTLRSRSECGAVRRLRRPVLRI